MKKLRDELSKNKVNVCFSEYELSYMISEFLDVCISTDCHNCNVVKNSEELFNKELCLARYIYERIEKI